MTEATSSAIKAVSLPLLLVMTTSAFAQTGQRAFTPSNSAAIDPQFAAFAPQANPIATHIDYSVWDKALGDMVLGMGRSLRQGAPSVDPELGTRFVFGHDSRYRLEGNRIAFSFFSDDWSAMLTEYRKDLEATADIVDIAKLSRNEQLAYWTNLHNVAVIEQIALNYPVTEPSKIRLGEDRLAMDEARFITVAGVKMSPRDIRTKIVYPNWSDPKVIYGFFRGSIGGPSILKEAFEASNINGFLDDSASEFVNSLRGTEKSGRTLHVSEIYQEARPYFFARWPQDLKDHLRAYAEDDVAGMLNATTDVRSDISVPDIADLAGGERSPIFDNVTSNGQLKSIRISSSVTRLLAERSQKISKIIKRGGYRPRVIVGGVEGESMAAAEVE